MRWLMDSERSLERKMGSTALKWSHCTFSTLATPSTKPKLELTITASAGKMSSQPRHQDVNSIIVNIEKSSSQIQSQLPQRKRKFRSRVWEHYELVSINGKEKAVCNYCKHAYAVGAGTKGLHDHQKICKMRSGQKRIDSYQSQSSGKKQIKKSKVDGGGTENSCQTLTTQHFDNDFSKGELARMIVMHDYPLSIVEHEGFRDFCRSLQPLFEPVCRNTIRNDIVKMYEEEMAREMRLLGNIQGRVAITSDLWTSSNQKRGYMTVTAHFIDDSWQLQSRLLRFMYVPCPLSAVNLSNALMECLLDWHIDRKLSTLTLDNCPMNNCMIDILLDKVSPNSLIMCGRLFHMKCVAHVLNSIVKSGLEVIDLGIEKIRDSVAFWTATPKRMEKFEETTRQLNIGYEKRLVLDCKTRWNSTYLMLSVALNYKDVFYSLKQCESQYRTLPEESDWDLAKEMCDRLKIFYSVTEMFSETKYPTINLFFPKICEIKLALRRWLSSSYVEISNMASNMIAKFDRYWDDVHGVLAMASLLDPRFKLKLPQYFFPLIYGEDRAEDEVKHVRKLCEDIFIEYQSKVGQQLSQDAIEGNSCSNVTSRGDIESLDGFFSWNIESSGVNEKSEFDCYLEEKTLPGSYEFDVLGWWRLNGIKYPIILLPSTLEAIMCTQNWLWVGKRGNIVNGIGDIHVDEENDVIEVSSLSCAGASKM
ncbi:hypothetical protein LWI28_004659 [Acer negundo]|uniref:BED-type domain-containing protein n=1 Tax=Acer negundo TaxID=4023 RepID=A0AAD5P0P5_ACENE|nr:hypothetical protein LWI28_004659 [Acer negundo]